MEIEQYLHVLLPGLLRDDSSAGVEDLQSNYFDLVASKTQDSLLSFDGVKVLPPLLSEADQQEMREYRQKAMNLEQKLFEVRREKYSNLLLQVMQLTDKFQAEIVTKKDKSADPKQQQTYSMRTEDLSVETLTIKTNNSDKKAHQPLTISSENNKTQHEHQTLKDEDDSLVPIFQKPKLYNSSSPGYNKSRASNASLQSEVPSAMSMSESVGTIRSSILGRESVMSSSSTLRGSDQNLLRETLESRQDVNPSDSLASTVLSMAFTESSFVSQQSTAAGPHQSLKSVQRQLNMDNANHNLYQSYYHNVNPLSSTPNDLQQAKMTTQKITTKKTASKLSTTQRTSVSSKANTKAITEQDKALEKLELMKQKLLEEKEKQMILLKQQELARLRKSKEKPGHLVSKEYYEEVKRNVYSPGHIASRPGSDMYSIPERSFEGTASFTQGDQIEIESASDKENNAYSSDLQQDAHHCNNDDEMLYGNQVLDRRNDLELRYSSEIESRPISVHSKQSTSRDHRRSSLYIRQEFQKQFEIELSKENNGKSKFSILTAYAKGFMTRRVLQTEKVQAIIKTIKDTSEFLADISKEGTTSYQDKTLQQRVQAQLVAAKNKLHNIFFTISISERMAYVEHSRNVAREKEDRMNAKTTTTSRQLTRKLSAATLKAMQRRQVETNNNSEDIKTSAGSQQVKRRNVDTRALKPVQSTKSPQVPEKGRLQVKRRSLASPLARHSIGKKNYTSRPATAVGTRPTGRKSITRSSKEETAEKPTRPSQTNLEGRSQITKRTTKPNSNTENNTSKLPVKKRGSLGGGLTYRVSKEDSEKVFPKSRPSTAMAATHQPVPGQMAVNNRPKTAMGTRRVTRAMAAKFNKQ